MVNVVHIDCEVDPRKIHTKTSRLVFIMSQVFLSARHTSCHNDLEEDGLILPQVLVGDLGRAGAKIDTLEQIGDPGGRHASHLRGTYPKGGSPTRATSRAITRYFIQMMHSPPTGVSSN